MPMRRTEEYPEHEPGTVPYVVSELMRRDTRTMRRASLDAGLASDSIRNICRGAARSPRAATLAGLARTFGVDVRVIRGQDPLPEPGDHPPRPAESVSRKPTAPVHTAAKALPPRPALDTSHDARRAMSRTVHQAVMDATADGLDAEVALKAATVSAALAASGGGMESSRALRIVELVADECC